MIETFEAISILAFAVFPGATFVWALERAVGKWEFGLSDRLLRFVVYSALIHAPFFPLTAWLVGAYLADPQPTNASWSFVVWPFALVYAFGPALLGHGVGDAVRNRKRWAELFTGRDPAPQAWDHLFLIVDEPGWIRLKLKTGTWIAGVWTRDDQQELRSYAGGFPHPADLYLAETVEVDPEDGSFLLGDDGNPIRQGAGVLVRHEEVEYLVFTKG